MINKFIPAANTPKGFVSFFDKIVNEPAMERVLYIKGGPGTGKSTFMKSVGSDAINKGYQVLQLPCSSDLNSLDMLIIKELKTVLVDATAPHNIDPGYPGIIGETVNLARFLDEGKIKAAKPHVQELIQIKNTSYRLLYNYLAASESLIDGINNIAALAMDEEAIRAISEEIYSNFLFKQQPLDRREAFMNCLTTDGYVNMFDLLSNEKNVGIKCDYHLGVWELFKHLDRKINANVHRYYSTVKPEQLSHITAGNINVVSNPLSICDYEYDLNSAFRESVIKKFKPQITNLKKSYEILVENAAYQLRGARGAHFKMEEYYVEAMDFDGASAEMEKWRSKIFS